VRPKASDQASNATHLRGELRPLATGAITPLLRGPLQLGQHAQLGPLGRSLARAVRTGASVAEAMTRLAEDLRRTARTEAEGRARAVAVKAAAPLGLCLLPAFALVGVVPLLAGAVTRFLAP